MPNTLVRLRNLPLAHCQRWLRCLLACVAFSALHGLLGAWVVPAVASGPVFEVCTPQGLQWVLLDDADSSLLGGSAGTQPLPQGLAKPCVWAAAWVGAPPAAATVRGALTLPLSASVPLWSVGELVTVDTMQRVLLMAPMRAPPA